ncbi:MAG: pyruvate ferredoxin oxidoreductase [Bacteroidales bacterium]|nr:pyruvate ferredoxin oxidoreductase [Bacteroidales bacterium]
MDYKYIEQLLERYWACETTLQEESILRNFFAQNDVPASLMPYKSIFQCQVSTAEQHLSDNFDKRILSLIEKEQKESEKDTVKVRKVAMSYRLRPFLKAAAVVAIVLCFSMAVQTAMEHDQDQQTSNVINLPPQIVRGDIETANATTSSIVTDSLDRVQINKTTTVGD